MEGIWHSNVTFVPLTSRQKGTWRFIWQVFMMERNHLNVTFVVTDLIIRGTWIDMLSDEGKKPFKCGICDYRCSHKSYMNRHIAKKHEGKKWWYLKLMKMWLCSEKIIKPHSIPVYQRNKTFADYIFQTLPSFDSWKKVRQNWQRLADSFMLSL